MTAPQTLTGTRRAILRSLYVTVLCAALAALVTSMLPGRETIYPFGAQAGSSLGTQPGDGVGVRYDAAGGPLLALAMVAATLLSGVGLVVPRRETTVLAAGTLTVLAIPIGIWLALSRLDDPMMEGETRALWPAHVLDLSLPVVAVAGPLLAIVGSFLFRLEARTGRPTIPVATARGSAI